MRTSRSGRFFLFFQSSRVQSPVIYNVKAKEWTLFLLPLFLFFSCTACSLPFGEPGPPSELTILSWNVQNLFDDVADGGEYDEFNPEEGEWSTPLFYKRLNRVGEVLSRCLEDFPQILLLQEVENLNTLSVLGDEVLGNHYPWQILLEEDDMSIHTAVLSSVPVKSVSRLETGHWGQLRLRPILEVRFDLNGRDLIVFNNHWKSRSGGVAATEEGRLVSASILVNRIRSLIEEDPDVLIIAAGDFNENHDEYKKIGRAYRTALIPAIESVPDEWDDSLYICSDGSDSRLFADKVVLYSPWYDVNSAGSYVYKSKWSKIDHFFLWKSLFDGSGYEYESFEVIKEDMLLNEYNFPARWDTYKEEGYSDHLPVLLKLREIDI